MSGCLSCAHVITAGWLVCPTSAGAPGLLSVNVNMALKAGQGIHYEFSDRGAQIVEQEARGDEKDKGYSH